MASNEFWLSYNNHAESLQLPVNPGDFTANGTAQNESNMVAGVGEVVVIQDPMAQVFQFSSHFPKHWAPYCSYKSIPDPWDAVNTILKWRATGNPIRFIVTGTNINYAVSIEAFNYSEKGGDPGTIWFDLTLKEYRFISSRKIDQLGSYQNSSPRPNSTSAPNTYTVVSGDCLWNIAKKLYGDGSQYTKIASANNISSPWIIHPGQVLRIP